MYSNILQSAAFICSYILQLKQTKQKLCFNKSSCSEILCILASSLLKNFGHKLLSLAAQPL